MKLTVTQTALTGVLLLEPKVFGDERGFFYESFNAQDFAAATGLNRTFVQDNHSGSARNVLRGLHYQTQYPQGKLVRVLAGEVFDVAVDLRRHSSTFGQWIGITLSTENRRQLWIPEGFAHGFLVLSEQAEVLYKTTEFWHPEFERCLLWNDAEVGIRWPITEAPMLSPKDSVGEPLREAEAFTQPSF
jgi:dTDP-4-dehydrorhamnose 3,5-epimerase